MTIYVQSPNNKEILAVCRLILKQYLKKWWVVNLGNVFVMREKFLDRHEAEMKNKRDATEKKK
jgi:hypothetical protein